MATRMPVATQLTVDSATPAGNILVDRIDGDDVYLHQDPRDTDGWWFYWAFRVRGGAGRALRFHFTDGGAVGTRGPACSFDGGLTWQWLNRNFTPERFDFAVPADVSDVRFAFGMVYTQANWERFLARVAPSPHLRAAILTRSRKGRPVELLYLGCLDARPARRVVITARHHCCEMMANYVLEGIIEAVLAGTDDGERLRRTVQLLVVPFADKDGVEDGDQGKNRRPRDHGRDYLDVSLYPETAALRELLPRWGAEGVDAALDVHCPWIRGDHNEALYQVGKQNPDMWVAQHAFGALLERVQSGVLDYRSADDLPFGQSWNTAANYGGGMSFARWAQGLPGMRLATSFEIPYATAHATEVNAGTARQFGHDLGRALAAFL